MLDMVAELDLNGRYRYLSPSVEEILGYRISEVIGRDPMEFIHPEDVDRVRKTLQSVGVREVASTLFRCRHAQGHYLWMEANGRPCATQGGAINGVVVGWRDVTERVEAEASLRASASASCGLSPTLRRIKRLTALCGELLKGDYAPYCRPEDGMLSIWALGTRRIMPMSATLTGAICFDRHSPGHDAPLVVSNLPQTEYAKQTLTW
jgi:PAS domain S-box-containing protein